MNKFKNVMAIASVVLTVMTGLCTVINTGVNSVEEIRKGK